MYHMIYDIYIYIYISYSWPADCLLSIVLSFFLVSKAAPFFNKYNLNHLYVIVLVWVTLQQMPEGFFIQNLLNYSWQRFLSYRNQSTDTLCKSMDYFLYDRELRQERVKKLKAIPALISLYLTGVVYFLYTPRFHVRP